MPNDFWGFIISLVFGLCVFVVWDYFSERK
jgi:hypothetical protein